MTADLQRPPDATPRMPLESIERAHRLLVAHAEGETETLLQMQGLPKGDISIKDLCELALEQQKTILALCLTTHVATRELAEARGLTQQQIRDYVLWYVQKTNDKNEVS